MTMRPFYQTVLPILCILSCTLGTIWGAELEVSVVDGEGRPVWARMEVRGSNGRMVQPEFSLRDRTAKPREGGKQWYLGSFVFKGPELVTAPEGDYTIIAERGPEFDRFEETITLSDQQPLQLQIHLERWIDMEKRGWYSGDFHIHRPVEDVKKLALAEDLNLSVVFTMWNKASEWEGLPFPPKPQIELSPRHLITVLNAEDERGGGAWMLHNLRKKINLAVDGRWFPPGIEFIRQAKQHRYYAEGFPWVDVEKPFWWEVPVVMAISPPDSIGVLHNHFNQYGIHNSEAWGRPRDEKEFPGDGGFVEHSLNLYYRFLNLGMDIPASAGSASGVLPNPVGYNRVYVRPREKFSVRSFYDGLRHGPSFVTNGPMLFFDVVEGTREVEMALEVQSRKPIQSVELIANGKVIQTFEPEPGQTSFHTELSMDSGFHSWVAARCFVRSEDTIRMAHSRPVMLFDGAWDGRGDAQYFVEWMDELIQLANEEEGRFSSNDERDAVLALYQEARRFYQQKSR